MVLVNYNLANEHHRFIWVLVPLVVLTFVGICLYHPSPPTVLLVIGIGGFALFFFLLAFTIFTFRSDKTPDTANSTI
jgi:hypothetical protein